jgi:hypothetical protein
MDSFHGPWTMSGLVPRWTAVVRPRVGWRACQRMAHRRYSSPAVTARGGGGRGGHGSVGGALTGDRAVMKQPADDGKAVVIEGTRWG